LGNSEGALGSGVGSNERAEQGLTGDTGTLVGMKSVGVAVGVGVVAVPQAETRMDKKMIGMLLLM